jgi:hypothetical protein
MPAALRFVLLLVLIAAVSAAIAVLERPHQHRAGSPPVAALR